MDETLKAFIHPPKIHEYMGVAKKKIRGRQFFLLNAFLTASYSMQMDKMNTLA